MPVTTNMKDASVKLINTNFDSVTRYQHAEQMLLHGDPL
jgi:hypothetical protein